MSSITNSGGLQSLVRIKKEYKEVCEGKDKDTGINRIDEII